MDRPTLIRPAPVSPPTRDVILDAAERHFALAGFAATSVRDIAADAGLKNQASLYHYFRDKRQLYEAVLQRGVDSISFFVRQGEHAIDAAPGDGIAARGEAIDATIDRVLDYLIAHPNLAGLLARAALDDGPFMREALRGIFQPLFVRGVQALVDAEGGMWQQSELPHVAAGLYHLIFGYFASAALLEAVMPDDPFSDHALARQRRFLKTAVGQLLGVGSRRVAARIVRD